MGNVDQKGGSLQVLGRRRSRYKRELRELDHELVRIEGDKSKMEDGENHAYTVFFLCLSRGPSNGAVFRFLFLFFLFRWDDAPDARGGDFATGGSCKPVSYTHLTLPTILLV